MKKTLSRKDFLVVFYKQLLQKNKYVFITPYLNFDKNFKQIRKDLFKKNIFFEVLVSKVFSRAILPLGGSFCLIGMQDANLSKLIPSKYFENTVLLFHDNTIYSYSLFLEAHRFMNSKPCVYAPITNTNKIIHATINLQLNLLKNILQILCLKNAHN